MTYFDMNNKIIVIGGPTASYKSSLAAGIAERFDGIVINADSVQVYNEIPIISSQPTIADFKRVPHKLYGFTNGENVFSVGKWLECAVKEIHHSFDYSKVPIVVGGTGMYINSLINGLSRIPEIEQAVRENARALYDRVGKDEFYQILIKRDPTIADNKAIIDKQRIIRAYEVIEQTGRSISYWHQMAHFSHFDKESFIYITSNLPRDELYKRCDERFLTMIEDGALDEVEYLNKNVQDESLPIMKSLGVRELSEYLRDEISLKEAISKAQTSTRRFAKRQVTWFKNQINEIDKIQYSSMKDFESIYKKLDSLFPLMSVYYR
jgi:tRNA dimethylallyltransferase